MTLLHFLVPRSSVPTNAELSSQWANPGDILSLLLIVGSDIVQSALAQLSGGFIAPVCFSFGWVAYAFTTLAAMAGTGRLMPATDFPCKVINLENGYMRENRSWVIGRLLRDAFEANGGQGMSVKVFEAPKRDDIDPRSRQTNMDVIWWISLAVMMVQMAVAAIPWALYNDWGVFMITAVGTLLALLTGWLPQWKIEKLAARKESKKLVAITPGNGSQQILIVKGHGKSIDLEDLAGAQSPKDGRLWSESKLFTKAIESKRPYQNQPSQEQNREVLTVNGLPLGFWFTRVFCSGLTLCWIALLISTSGLKAHTWFLLCVGAVGMLQNSIVAAISRKAETRGLYFNEIKSFRSHKTMDALMDLEFMMPGKIKPLLKEYLPGELRPEEQAWWVGQPEAYEKKRLQESNKRGIPASMRKETPLF
ncbi:MAG: hypothetical protein Q9167_005026 [Letrouitia subvulpina]